MSWKIESGNLCTVRPLTPSERLCKGDIVLCHVSGKDYLHLIGSIMQFSDRKDRYQIENNKNHPNGWISRDRIYGILTKVEK